MAKKHKKKAKREMQQAPQARPMSPFEAMDQLLEGCFPRRWMRLLRADSPSWAEAVSPFEGKFPNVDVIDRDDEVVVKAELPGVDRKDIEVSVTGNRVSIKAIGSHEGKEEKGSYYRCEMSRGSFVRHIGLPAEIDKDKAKAKLKDGVLELSLPKVQKAKRRSITLD